MKFPRNTRLLRSPFDVAPFAAVFFLLVIFVMLAVFLPAAGIPLQLPISDSSPGKGLPGTDKPSVAVAIDSSGRFYFANQIVGETQLKSSLGNTVKHSREPLTLVIQADKAVTLEQLARLTLFARDAGITNALIATLPRVISAPAQP
jgi:biopolymer transport protein ExbD